MPWLICLLPGPGSFAHAHIYFLYIEAVIISSAGQSSLYRNQKLWYVVSDCMLVLVLFFFSFSQPYIFYWFCKMNRETSFPLRLHVCPAKTQISPHIRVI